MKLTLSKNLWQVFCALTVLLTAAVLHIEWVAGQIGAPADGLRLSVLIAIGLSLALIVLLMLMIEKGDEEAAAREAAETAALTHRCHLGAVEAAAGAARAGTLDEQLVSLANQLERLSSRVHESKRS